ncbi:MAG TPA: hypothetical protein VMQ99_10575, partial [Acetobacteraceae bacterium]|nr:hypothetical protein [Acetobacteraceae bacterium]
ALIDSLGTDCRAPVPSILPVTGAQCYAALLKHEVIQSRREFGVASARQPGRTVGRALPRPWRNNDCVFPTCANS